MIYAMPRFPRYFLFGKAGIVETSYSVLLVLAAFWLGACPFSLWVGLWLLGRDIRDYGDGNPGGTNVFRAGGRKSFCLAALLDTTKGVPFVVLAYSFFRLPEPIVMAIALSAILGNAFSPLLRLKGGKSIGVTFGTLFALPQHDILIAFAILLFLGFLFIDVDAWIVVLGAAGSLAYIVVTMESLWASLFMLCVLLVLAIKHLDDLRTMPRVRGRLIAWLQSGGRGA